MCSRNCLCVILLSLLSLSALAANKKITSVYEGNGRCYGQFYATKTYVSWTTPYYKSCKRAFYGRLEKKIVEENKGQPEQSWLFTIKPRQRCTVKYIELVTDLQGEVGSLYAYDSEIALKHDRWGLTGEKALDVSSCTMWRKD